MLTGIPFFPEDFAGLTRAQHHRPDAFKPQRSLQIANVPLSPAATAVVDEQENWSIAEHPRTAEAASPHARSLEEVGRSLRDFPPQERT